MTDPRLTRREVVTGAVAAALGTGALSRPAAAVAAMRRPARDRVAIVGAGAGGVMAAYFLAGATDVEMFEARSKIGGHCDSRVIDEHGQKVTADLGAQFFHPDTHPIYVTLLQQLGLYDPARPDADDTFQAPGSLTVLRSAGGAPVFASVDPLATPPITGQFAAFIPLAREAVLSGLPWTTTVDTWVRGLSVTQAFKDEVALPWITALIGCSRAQALQASARSILQTFALEFPAELTEGATTYTSRIGLQGNLQRMLDASPGVRVHLGAPATSLTPTRDGWFVTTPHGRRGPYRFVVLNAPPPAGHALLTRVPQFGRAAALLSRYSYFASRIVIHTDPAYVSADRADWAAYNAEITGRQCEGSVWYGGLDPALTSGTTIDVFKSWAERRRRQPIRILAQRGYRHPHITPAMVDAARDLEPWQGHRGVYFSGVYTNGFDSQESAVYSAMKVAERLAPRSATLTALKSRLAAAGLAHVSYRL
jgi:predicted NAD/FAD-binding protein